LDGVTKKGDAAASPFFVDEVIVVDLVDALVA
jgi:hypothetical protein